MISIVIPTYNHCGDLLKPCIQSILNTTMMGDVEIIVVANGCTDDTREYLDGLSGFRLKVLWFDNPIGFPKAINEGFKALHDETDYVVVMNNDCVLTPQPTNSWIQILLGLFRDPKVGIAGPLRLYDNVTKQYYIHFFIAAIKREVINSIGMLDETFAMGNCEDTDYCIRAKLKGYKIADVGVEFDLSTTMKRGNFPIVHAAHKTVDEIPGWNENVNKNLCILGNKYKELPPEKFEDEVFIHS